DRIHTATVSVVSYGGEERPQVGVILRTRNTKANQLGLPLPSGAFLIEQDHWGRTMVIAEPTLRDTAEDEKIELSGGMSPDVTVVRRTVKRDGTTNFVEVEIANATAQGITFELKIPTYGNVQIIDASAKWEKRDGIPLFAVPIPANSSVVLRYTAKNQ
ncbi:MAG: hypothetical protein J0M19_11975, partial [Sphingomonadales bacterium]|nr:hypothetical protein [Sphingomonadales bacterium]